MVVAICYVITKFLYVKNNSELLEEKNKTIYSIYVNNELKIKIKIFI